MMIYDENLLIEYGLVDTTRREMEVRDFVDVICNNCKAGNSVILGSVKKKYKKTGESYSCKKCAIRSNAHKIYSSEYLSSLGLVDTDSRYIEVKKRVDAKCQACNIINSVELKCLKDIYKKHNRGYNCRSCGTKKAMTPETAEKRRVTMLKRHGVEHPIHSEDIKKKIKRTNLEKYGVEYSCQSQISRENMVKALVKKGGSSSGELEVKNWIESEFGLKTEKSYIGGSEPREIDILIREKGIGIEYNGDFWHSERVGIGRAYHLHKTIELRKQKKCQLIHIFESEWKNHPERVKAFLSGHLQKGIPIRASKCSVEEVSWEEAKEFCNSYHLQGKPHHSILNLGLRHEGELISLMTFSKPHRQNMTPEPHLSRYVIKPGYRVHGGLSRLSKHAFRRLGTFITFVHLRLSSGDSYLKAGYEKIGENPPDYWYWDIRSKTYVSKQKRRKSKVNTPEGVTEKEHAWKDGLFRVWDCGKIKLRYC